MPRNQAHFWWVSNLAGRNTREARAGLESEVVDADPPELWGRPRRTGKEPTRAPVLIRRGNEHSMPGR
jgi:hypothetical protein